MNSDGTLFWTVVDMYKSATQKLYVCKVKDQLYEVPFGLDDKNHWEFGEQCLQSDGLQWKYFHKVEQFLGYRKVE